MHTKQQSILRKRTLKRLGGVLLALLFAILIQNAWTQKTSSKGVGAQSYSNINNLTNLKFKIQI